MTEEKRGNILYLVVPCYNEEEIIERYLANSITQAIVLSGLEPLDSIVDVISFIDALRNKYKCNDDVVIYTGYTQFEVESGEYGIEPSICKNFLQYIKDFPNIYMKFGRYLMKDTPREDKVLGITLASSNQYGVKISNENV